MAQQVAQFVGDGPGGSADVVGAALQLARRWGVELPEPGAGRTRALWRALAEVAAVDLTVARVIEPHLDALAILAEARRHGHPVPDTLAEPRHTDPAATTTWGSSPPKVPVCASRRRSSRTAAGG